MRAALIFAMLSAFTGPAHAWERLITQQGTVVEGDVTQQEFVLNDPTGGEVAIPRAAIDRFEASPEGLKAFIKDGTVVAGTLQGKLEIEDGMIKRRFAGADIKRVDFDLFIAPEKGEQYDSCPIRVEIDAGAVLLGNDLETRTSKPRVVACKEMRIANLALRRNGKIKPGKPSTLEAELVLSIPPGEDQLADVSIKLVQADAVLAKVHQRLTVGEGENATVKLTLTFPGEKLDLAGPAPRLLLQLVSQDAEREVERGGVFWWFTVQIG